MTVVTQPVSNIIVGQNRPEEKFDPDALGFAESQHKALLAPGAASP